MYNLDDIVRIYFSNTTAREVLENRVKFNDYPEEVFRKQAMMLMKHYSDTENEGLYDYAKGHLHLNKYNDFKSKQANVFEALAILADKLLLLQDGEIVCRYSEFVRWRNVTTCIGETSLVCAFLANWSAKRKERWNKFFWNTSIGHNNVQLNKLLNAGVAENHFHLFGSAPIFEIAWLNLMNNVQDKKILSELREIDKNRRSSHTYNSLSMVKERLEQQHLQAAFIRAVLTLFLLHKEEKLDAGHILKNYQYLNERIEDLLTFPEHLFDERSAIQSMIGDLKNIAEGVREKNAIDYALYLSDVPAEQNINAVFAGERWLIYNVLRSFYEGDELYPQMYKWLYAYLLIKVDMRSEILQVNDNIGFQNFSIYTGRKGKFLYNNVHKRLMVKEAVRGSLQTGNIKSLEIRVSPGDTPQENMKWISEYDRIIMGEECEEELNKAYYYVFHFIKAQDQLPSEEDYLERRCRHYERRKRWEKQARAIISFRNMYPEMASRVLGIDACAQEIGCRPEVFGTVFRRLGQHICEIDLEEAVPQLKKTFHVGEDFLDVVDGLRAVDESLRFLNLQCGDRIGHGTVLGIDVRKWYETKHNTIIISCQDYLDNIVWLYHKLIEFRIEECELLKSFLLREFDMYFSEVYERNMRKDEIDRICSSMPQNVSGRNQVCQFNIHNYYESWKLRGDEPSLYDEGFLNLRKLCEFDEYVMDIKNKENDNIRKNIESTLLYYYYHYSWEVRTAGAQMREFYVPPYYVESIVKVQKAMQYYVGASGVGIETNPTSNFLISSMSAYEEHPILQFYNKDLTLNNDELENCPQLFVSVNTDDKGVFRTSIENEYAFLACALEKLKNQEGNYKYNRQMIYQWLDNIREMGLKQSFRIEN